MIIDARHRFTEKQIMDAFFVCNRAAKEQMVRKHMAKLDALVRDLKKMRGGDDAA